MALSEDQIIDLFNDACRETFNGLERFRYFARAIEAEVRKQDAALIQQLVAAIDDMRLAAAYTTYGAPNWDDLEPALAAARARLLDSDLSNLTERGAHAWAGVDAQDLRDGGKP